MRRRKYARRERGVALVVVLGAVAILSIVLADMHENTSTAYAVSTAERDRLQAEYMAKSGLNLTRLLVLTEPQIRQTFAPMYMAMFGRPPPQLPVWTLANVILSPFCDYDQSERALATSGIDVRSIEGLGDTPGTCEIQALAENSKININDPLSLDGERARRSIAMQLFSMMGGHQSPSPYDPLFENPDGDGQNTTRLDVVAEMIDWWDQDTQHTQFDPGSGEVSFGTSEDDFYQRLDDPYHRKNAPFDSIEELRLVRGVSDDFWATFIEPDPEDPEARSLTIYGSGAVNPNEAPPQVLLARVCSFLSGQPLCADPAEAAKFIQILNTARSMVPAPFFTRSTDFLDFLEGKGGENGLYPMLQSFLGADNPLLFRPIAIPQEARQELDRSFVTAARILSVIATGRAGRSRVRIRTVLNFDERWSPPPPIAGRMPPLGVFHYYRVD
ncbi:MAG: general secretion pathway protein GspK [Myxococcota bacterium]